MKDGKVWKKSQRKVTALVRRQGLPRPRCRSGRPIADADQQREEHHVGGDRGARPEAGQGDEGDEAGDQERQLPAGQIASRSPRPAPPPRPRAPPGRPCAAGSGRAAADRRGRSPAARRECSVMKSTSAVPERRGGDGHRLGQGLGIGRDEGRDEADRTTITAPAAVRKGWTTQKGPSGLCSGCFSVSAKLRRSSITAMKTMATPISSAWPMRRTAGGRAGPGRGPWRRRRRRSPPWPGTA